MRKFDPERLREMLDNAESASEAAVRGRLFEDLLTYIFECVPEVRVVQNSVNFFGAEQVDIAVGHRGAFGSLPNHFLVECKNYEHPVDSKAVGYFLYICISKKVQLAVICASNGLTGNADDLTYAHSLALAASALGLRLVVLTRNDIVNLTDHLSIVELLEDRHLKAIANGGIGA